MIGILFSLGLYYNYANANLDDSETQCRDEFVLVFRINSNSFACVTDSTAGKWVNYGIAERVEQKSTQETQEIKQVVEYQETSEFFTGTNEIRKISSEAELGNILQTSALLSGQFYGGIYPRGGVFLAEEMTFAQTREGGPVPVPSIAADKSSDGVDYSTTNVQVENVDEPDFLKNDAKYVYIISQNTLTIIDAYPAESAEIVLKIALDIESRYLQNMFLNKDRLVIFYSGQSQDEIIPQYDFAPRPSYNPVTHALIIDVSDKENPSILKDYEIDCYFQDARMIGNFAYFVTNIGIDYQYPRFPVILEDSVPVLVPDVFYFDNIEPYSNFNTITAIDIFGDAINSETFLMGYTGTIYVSENNFYITYQQHIPYGYHEISNRDRFFDVVVPLLPKDIQKQIISIQNDLSTPSAAKWREISNIMQDSYNDMTKSAKEKLFDEIREKLVEYDIRIQEQYSKTIIHKISIDEENLDYKAKGSVPGRLLNQFSMDESGDRFRVATTNEFYIPYEGRVTYNSVYVMDEDLDIVGSLDKIAEDETIFSARFMGDRLYLVTFQQIDPFFVIDLSTDTPKILGELKIPGFSNYLHPYDEDLIIGVGRDTKETGNGRVQQLGIKIALFDVSNVEKPKVLDEVIIGDRSTNSAVLYNHKAFLFDKSKNILSIPIDSDVGSLDDISTEKKIAPYNKRWNGFYVYSLDPSNGFEINGLVTHFEGDSYRYGTSNARSFYIEDVLYTVSDSYLKMNDINNVEDEINSIKLSHTGGLIKYLED